MDQVAVVQKKVHLVLVVVDHVHPVGVDTAHRGLVAVVLHLLLVTPTPYLGSAPSLSPSWRPGCSLTPTSHPVLPNESSPRGNCEV